jgi:lipid-binding SYLF domain-containing protein
MKNTITNLMTAIALAMFTFAVIPAFADEDTDKARGLVTRSLPTLENFVAHPDMEWFRYELKYAKAVLIIPTLGKGGLIIGGYGGSGCMLARDEKLDEWSYPAFYTLGGLTFGFQIGGAVDELVLMAITPKGLDAMLTSSFKLGLDASVALGPIGTGLKGATADILAFSRSKGLFGGLTVEGAVVVTRDRWNSAYYGKELRPSEILVLRKASNTHADKLREAVKKAARRN